MSIFGKPVSFGGVGGGDTPQLLLPDSLFASLNSSSDGGNNGVFSIGGRVGGFTSASYVWRPRNANKSQLDVDWSKAFKIHATFRFSQVDNRSEALFGTFIVGKYWEGTVSAEATTTEWSFLFSTNGSAWTHSATIPYSSMPLSADVDYTLEVDYDGSDATVSVTDGLHTASATVAIGGALYHNSSYNLGFGGIAQNTNLTGRYCWFDPADTYIESGGVMVWGAKRAIPNDPQRNDNFHVNWDFSNPVNTGGQSSYSASSSFITTIDGWYAQNCVIALESSGIRITRREGYTGDGYFEQRFVLGSKTSFYGYDMTLSLMVDGDIASASFTVPSADGIISDSIITLNDVNIAAALMNNKLQTTFYVREATGSHVVNAIKLEVGNLQTLAKEIGGSLVLTRQMNADEEKIKKLFLLS